MNVWRKSSRSESGTGGGNCVEVAALSHGVGLRDSKNPRLPHLTVTPHAFRDLVDRIKHGES